MWQWRAVDACGKRDYCMPGNSAVPTATPELVLAGSLDGHLRIHNAETGEVIWDYDTARNYGDTLTGIPGRGGALEGGAAALLDGGMMFVNSGYMFNQHMAGNVLLAFKIESAKEKAIPSGGSPTSPCRRGSSIDVSGYCVLLGIAVLHPTYTMPFCGRLG